MERAEEPEAHFDPVTFDLAKGATVRVAMDEFWEQLSESDRRLGSQPARYFAIRVYSDEGTYPRRLVLHSEFRAGNDFHQCANHRLWTWVADLIASRHRFSYEDVEDFLEEFASRMDEFSAIGEDAADYIHKIHGGKQPLPYEHPPHEEFLEDRKTRMARERLDISPTSEPVPSADAETVLGVADEDGQNDTESELRQEPEEDRNP